MKRWTSLLLCLLLSLSCLPAMAAESSPRTVTWGLPANALVEDYDTNAFTLRLEEAFNIDIEFQAMEDFPTKFSVLVSSGSAIPDIVTYGSFDAASIYNYSSRGVFAPLTEYWNDPEMTKNFDSVLLENGGTEETKDYILKSITMPDGEIYAIPSYDENVWNLLPYRVWINQAWLDALGLSMPTTTEEFRAVLEAFVQDDPNGNGQEDEFGMAGASSGYGYDVTAFLLGAFLDANPDVAYLYVDENDQVKAAYTEPAFKAALEYLNDLCANELLSSLSFTQDGTQLKAIINAEESIIGVVCAGSTSNWIDYATSERFAEFTLLEPLTGPEGVQLAPARAPSVVSKFFVSAAAEDPAFLFSIGEATYDLSLRAHARFGLEGENWSADPEVIDQYVGAFESIGIMPRIAIVDDIWGKAQNNNWGAELLPFLMTQEFVMEEAAFLKRTPETDGETTHNTLQYELYPPHAPEKRLGQLIFTAEENEQLAQYQTLITDYVKESITAFVTGNLPLSQWDVFLAELENMGLGEYLAIQQAAYDRQNQ